MCDDAIPITTTKRNAKRIMTSKHAQLSTPPDFHVMLFSHSPPNTAAQAQWNLDSSLDDLSWEELPEQFRKRKVHLHTIMMNSSPASITSIATLQIRSCVDRNLQGMSWFPLPQGHQLLVSGIPRGTAVLHARRAATAGARPGQMNLVRMPLTPGTSPHIHQARNVEAEIDGRCLISSRPCSCYAPSCTPRIS